MERKQYAAQERRLTKEGPAVAFTLPTDAVLKKLIHALESPRPGVRYRVTVPSHVFAHLKRVLSSRAVDWLTRRASGGGKRWHDPQI